MTGASLRLGPGNNEITHELQKLNQNEMNRIGHVLSLLAKSLVKRSIKERKRGFATAKTDNNIQSGPPRGRIDK